MLAKELFWSGKHSERRYSDFSGTTSCQSPCDACYNCSLSNDWFFTWCRCNSRNSDPGSPCCTAAKLCSAGQSSCSGTSTDTNTDQHNCGCCGGDCTLLVVDGCICKDGSGLFCLNY